MEDLNLTEWVIDEFRGLDLSPESVEIFKDSTEPRSKVRTAFVRVTLENESEYYLFVKTQSGRSSLTKIHKGEYLEILIEKINKEIENAA